MERTLRRSRWLSSSWSKSLDNRTMTPGIQACWDGLQLAPANSLSVQYKPPQTNCYGVFTRSSKRPANFQQTFSNSRVFWIHLLEVCWTFAGSCKHPITLCTSDGAKVVKTKCLSCLKSKHEHLDFLVSSAMRFSFFRDTMTL